MPARRLHAIAWLLAAGLFGSSAATSASDPRMSSYSQRQVQEAAARGGDARAPWALASSYAAEGRWSQGWAWIEAAAPSGDEQIYFKAWLAWRAGLSARAQETLSSTKCSTSSCFDLSVNVAWDLGDPTQALLIARSWSLAQPADPRAYHALLMASLIARDYASFDKDLASRAWESDPVYAAWAAPLRALSKLRKNFKE